jgi:hypothetical protein
MVVETNAARNKGLSGETAGASVASRPQLREDAGRREAPSVHLTKSLHREKVEIDQNTGEIQRFRLNEKRREWVPVSDAESVRFERYALQGTARKVLADCPHPSGEKNWRVCSCLRKRVGQEVAVLYSPAVQRAHFGNLSICGSVWTCSVCGAKISERRKNEIEQAAQLHLDAGGALYMVTLTFAHHRADDLAQMIGDSKARTGLRGALARFRNGKGYKANAKDVGLVGLIRNLEVTHSWRNGWHPHLHELWLVSKKLTRVQLRAFQNEVFTAWRRACFAVGLGEPNRKHGVQIAHALTPAEYLQKWGREQSWGLGSELTKAHIKKNKDAKGATPFDLLRAVAGDNPNYSPEQATGLFRKYAKAFFRARQCFWTPGLKAAFGIEDKTDEQTAQDQEQDAKVLCSISKDEWRLVLAQPWDVRATILKLAESGGAEAVRLFVGGLRDLRLDWSGEHAPATACPF